MEKSSLVENDEKKLLEIEGKISDDLETIQEKMKKNKEAEDNLKRESDAESKRFEKDRKRSVRKDKTRKLIQNIALAFDPDTYASFIQNFEALIFVMFVDTILLLLLFSVLFGTYIILTLGSDNWFISLLKFGGAIITAITCIIIQMNVETKPKSGE